MLESGPVEGGGLLNPETVVFRLVDCLGNCGGIVGDFLGNTAVRVEC